MARLDEPIKLSDLPEPDNNFEPIPPGWYDATIVEADKSLTKSGDGEFIKILFGITGPSHSGRMVQTRLNIRNASTEAERIGRQQIGIIMRIAEISILEDPDQLIGLPISIKVAIRKSEQYGDQNEVRSFRELSHASKVGGQWALIDATRAKPPSQKAEPQKTTPPWACALEAPNSDDAMPWDENEASAVKNTAPQKTTPPWAKR